MKVLLGDKKEAKLGMKAWYPGSHDGFSGPHRIVITGITIDKKVEIKFFADRNRCWVDAKNIFAKEPKR